jgi:2-polyprenyl-6-methoxyphenol hydroxylase-like FAD-dependent oxidoreductase
LILGKTFKLFHKQNDFVEIEFEDGVKIKTDLLIGADGIHSRLRSILLPYVAPSFAGYTSWRAVVEREPFTFTGSEFSETWAPEGRFGIVPLAGNKIYWFACINSKLNDQNFKDFKVADLISNFRDFHPMIKETLELTKDSDLIHNDILSLPPLSQFAFDKVLLLGDAAHATTPNLAQGACQAIEDAVFLSKCLLKYPDNGEKAFLKYEELRLKRTREITKLSSTLGRVSQMDNPFLCKVRDHLFRMIPESVGKKQMRFLFDIDFSVN